MSAGRLKGLMMDKRRWSMLAIGLIVGGVVGWFSHAAVSGRYFVAVAADNRPIRLDRWTGRAWRITYEGQGENHRAVWSAIEEP